MRVSQAESVPSGLGRDAYRIVQEALTNIGKHAVGTAGEVRVSGAPGAACTSASATGSRSTPRRAGDARVPGPGCSGLQERVALAGGTLVHGPDDTGDFVVEAELPWPG